MQSESNITVALWLLLCCVMIFAMVILGGATRLTHSGLSIVEWEPITGFLPPLTETLWQSTFEKYQQYPEFQKLNRDMDLAGFKSIFWLEFLHRLWGRIIAIVFLGGFIFFLVRGTLRRTITLKLIVIFIFGALQGVLGWFMVKSGLADRPDISQYRLVAHLGLAVLLYGWIFWVALGILFPIPHNLPPNRHLRRLGHTTTALGILIFITILSGGFVAGTDAGFYYNTFPLMGESWIPPKLFILQPIAKNFFENIVTIQFTHRVLAILTLLSVSLLWLSAFPVVVTRRGRLALHCLLASALLQVSLGITTLLLIVPIPIALVHQGGALIMLTIALWTRHELHPAFSK